MRWFAIQLMGFAAWLAVYFGGRLVASAIGLGADLSAGDTAAVMFPTIIAVIVASAIWDRT